MKTTLLIRLLKACKLGFVVSLLLFSNTIFAQKISGYNRWIGTYEEVNGNGMIYDFKFSEDSKVEVEKQTGYGCYHQKFKVIKNNDSFSLKGDPKGEIPELNETVFSQKTERSFDSVLKDGLPLTIRPSNMPISLLHMAVLFLILFLGNELCRRSKVSNYILFFILPIALIPLWKNAGYDSWFRWIKLYSAVAGVIIFTLFRFHGFDKYKLMKYAVAGILMINIAEACTQDFSTGRLPNILNGIAGILNLISLSRIMGIKRDPQAPNDMLWPGMTIFWILAYDIWNVTFIYLVSP